MGVCQPILRIRRRIYGKVFASRLRQRFRIAAVPIAPPQGQIVSYAEQPATDIIERLTPIQMLEQRKKYVLKNLFGILIRQTEAPQVAKQRLPELVEESRHFLLQPVSPICGIGRRRSSQQGQKNRTCEAGRHEPVQNIYSGSRQIVQGFLGLSPPDPRGSAEHAENSLNKESLRLPELVLGCIALLFVGSPGALSAQITSATLSGTITDPTGKVVPAVDVTATGVDTGVASHTRTHGDGIYLLPALQPGRYRVTVNKQGFRRIEVTDVTLLGAASETITVEGQGININTIDGSVSTVIDREFVDAIPLNGRTLQNLLPIIPGIGYDTSNQGYTVNGTRVQEGTYWTVDGIGGNIGAALFNNVPDSFGAPPTSSTLLIRGRLRRG